MNFGAPPYWTPRPPGEVCMEATRILPRLKAWPEEHQIVVRILDRYVSLDDGSRPLVVAALSRDQNGELFEIDPRLYAIPQEELPWAYWLLSMGGVNHAGWYFPRSNSDGYAIVEFAKAGRLYSGDRVVQYAGGLSAVLAWAPLETGGQEVGSILEPPWKWLRGTRGPILSESKAVLADPGLNDRELKALLSLPALPDDEAEKVRKAWAKHWLLGPELLPLKPIERKILDRTLTWAASLAERAVDETSRAARKQLALRIELKGEDGATLDPLMSDGRLVPIKDDIWHRYHFNEREPLELGDLLARLEVDRRSTEAAIEYVFPLGVKPSLVQVVLHMVEIQPFLTAVLKDRPLVTGTRNGATCALGATIIESKVAGYSYELLLDIQSGGQQLARDVSALEAQLSSWFHRKVMGLMGNGQQAALVETQAGGYVIVNRDSLERCLSSIETMRDHTVNVGGRHMLSNGALLRLATTKGLPLEQNAILMEAKNRVARLLSAQALVPEREIDGIDGITFSPSQAAGVNWLVTLLKERVGGILADKRGAGKTFQALGAIAETRQWRRDAGLGPALILMELKELDHWVVKHLMKSCHGLEWRVYHGKSRPDHEEMLAADVVVTTYGMFQRHLDTFAKLRPGYIFADEAKRLKNRQSKTWKAIVSIRGSSIVSINGTPLTRNIGDVWSGFELAAPGFLGSSRRFSGAYRQGAEDPAYLPRLRDAMKPLFIRRDIDNGRGMPSKTLIPQLVTMKEAQVNSYAAVRERVLASLAAAEDTPGAKGAFRLRMELEQLRTITANPGRPGNLTSKGEAIQEMVTEFVDDGHQVLVFSHSNNFVDAIAEIIRAEGVPVSVYRGSNAKARNREKAMFEEGYSKVLVLSDLGAKGLDLPQATRVVITDPWVDADEEEQKADRARRFNSTKDLEVFHLICAGTLEEGAMLLLERNRQEEDAILEGAPAPAPGVGRRSLADDYQHLLSFSPEEGSGDD